MPKDMSALKKKSQKKKQTDKQDGDLLGELITAALAGDFLRRPAFMEALEKSGLVEYLTEVYRAQQIAKTEWIYHGGRWVKEEWEVEIEDVTRRFRENLPAALFAGSLINAVQVSSCGKAWATISKGTIRRLAEFHFLRKGRQFVLDGRGRKPKVEFHDVYRAILKRGADASRKGVAFDLGISEKTLDNWRKDNKQPSWKAVVKYVLEVEERVNERHGRNKLSD